MLREISDQLCDVAIALDKVMLMCEDLNDYLSNDDKKEVSFYQNNANIRNQISIGEVHKASLIVYEIQEKLKGEEEN